MDDEATSVALQPDGKIVLAGYSDTGSTSEFSLARYNTDGSLDVTFDGDGKLMTAVGSGISHAFGVAVQLDGKIIAAGFSRSSTDDFALVRYNPDGSLDSTFDGDGKLTAAIGGATDVANSVAVQPDGRIVAAGYADNGSNFDFALLRVKGDNLPPKAGPDTIILNEDSSASFSVLTNDYDPNCDPLVDIPLTQPTHGTLFVLGGGLVYQPDANYTGTDSFTYKLADDSGLFDIASVQLVVQPVNDAPMLVGNAIVPAVQQGTSNPPGRTIALLLNGIVTDVDTGDFVGGLAVVGNPLNADQGTWQYSTDDGLTWFDIGAVADDVHGVGSE